MPPAASDDLSRLQSRSLGDNNSAFPDDLTKGSPDNDLGGKSKKKSKSGAKAKAKAAKAAAAKLVSEDLIDASPPSQAEPSSYPDPDPPLEPSSYPDPDPPLVLQPTATIAQPVLDDLGALDETPENDLNYRTDKWANSVPFGKSPPNDVGDGDLPSGSPFGYLATPDKGGFSQPSSASPPPRTRPLSYGTGYASSNMSRQQSADRQKSQSLSSPFNNPIPLPHMPQAHFYGAPEIDLPVFNNQNRPAADGNYSYCAFDTLSSPFFKSTRAGGTVLLVGTDGGLEVLGIEERKTRLVGKLAGLNGRVIDAKLLPCNSPDDPLASSRPHVAVILHGPSNAHDDEGHASSAGSETNEIPAVHSGRHSSAERRSTKDDTRFYQTRVEVFSLRTGDHITSLFAASPSPCYDNIPGLPMFAPAPAGNLKLFASSSHVVLGSGVSGEVYIYSMNGYQCLGKTWTNIHAREARRYSTSSSSTDPDGSRTDSPHGTANSDGPILALKGRWLAIVPPSSGYRTSLRGSVPPSLIRGKVFGMDTRSAPARPVVNCATDVGDGESLFDKVARGVTQELVRGARWMGDQGLQAWNNYWNKDQPQNSAPRRNLMDFPQPGYMFPPTHAQDTQASTPAEPDLVSLIDLKRLEDGGEMKNALFNPLATFQVPNGCSFLSFSPNGLMLLTASKKGDVQYVWDLLQAKYCRSGAFLSDEPVSPSAKVRQVARYARLTTSHIVDVIWCPPSGDRLAIITRKGTVHVFDLPRTAFQWPPFRRARPAANAKSPAHDHPSDEFFDKAATANPLSAAFKLVGDRTQPIFAAVRGRTPSAAAAFPPVSGFGIPSAAGVRGGKVVAAGLSKSMGAATGTVNTLRHVGENRLHLTGLARDPAGARVTWIISKGQPFLGVVDSGFFRLYRVRRSLSTQKGRQLLSVIGGKEMEFRLPPYLQSPCGAMPVGTFNPEQATTATLALPSSNSRPSPGSKLKCQPLSQAEIETNAPYQPFHTDQRVSLFVYSETNDTMDSASGFTGQWVFGDNMATSKLHVRPFSSGGDDEEDDTVQEHLAGAGGEMENLISRGSNSAHGEEVVITTRRKKKRSPSYPSTGGGVEDGFFEDDCDFLDFARDRV